MAKKMDCFITSIKEELYHDEIEGLVVTGTQGEMGILPGHAPLLTELAPGPIQLRKRDGEEDIFYLSGGFLEVQPNSVHILADYALRGDDLNEEAAEEARHQAAEVVTGKDKQAAYDYATSQAQLIQAMGQLRTLRRIREKLKR